MVVVQYLISLFLIGGLSSLYFCLAKKKTNFDKMKMFKIASMVLMVVFFFRYMLGEDAIERTVKLQNINFETKFFTFVSLILNWFMFAIILLLILYPFFKNKFLTNIVKFFALPVLILAIIAMVPMSIGIVGKTNYYKFDFRAILMSVELAIAAVYSFIVFWENDKFKVEKKDGLKLLYIIPLMLLATMPAYMIQGLIGFSPIAAEVKDLDIFHRLIIYFSIILPIGLYFLLHKKDKETCRLCLLYIALGTMISFSMAHRFESFLNVTNWPFHLCNTAMYIIPLCLIFKWDKLFYFTYFINVLGAFLALAMPNYAAYENMFSTSLVRFYINHYIAFFMPVLIVALKVYDRPKIRQFIYSMVGFMIYFILVLILNAWFSNYGSVDYFFLNSDFIVDKLGKWAEDLMKITWSFNINDLKFVFYPVYQVIFFVVYVMFGAGMWFLYEWAYQAVDTLYDMADRKRKIKLDEIALKSQLNGRSIEEPMNEAGKNQLQLINFSKRYGSSNVYAVKDANLVIKGGEIFGFLGPNGAGKSTIIKSIVGIQPITEGRIEVCGYDVDKQSVFAKRQIGFVPDHYALYEKLTGREYINYIADLYKVSKEDRDAAIDKYVKLLQLEEAFDNKMQTYSHGMKQKISIISALVHNPKIWILDEPLIGLDPTSIFQVKECMKEHAKQGNIVFFSSHIIDVVERICDRVAIIQKGHILACKDVEEIEKETTLEEFYLQSIKENVQATKVSKEELQMEKTQKRNQKKMQKEQLKMQKKEEKMNAKQEKKLGIDTEKKD